MTWARNYGATHYGAASTETGRAKRIITWKCLDCPSLIYGPGKKRCAPCYDIILGIRNRATSKRQYHSKKAKNGGAA